MGIATQLRGCLHGLVLSLCALGCASGDEGNGPFEENGSHLSGERPNATKKMAEAEPDAASARDDAPFESRVASSSPASSPAGDVTYADGGHDAAISSPDREADGGEETPADTSGWTLRDYLQCHCFDDTQHEMCIDLERDDPTTFCDSVCAPHQGRSGSGSGPNTETCKPPTVGGRDRVTCHCLDAHEESLCAKLWCVSVDQQLYVCEPVCASHDGIESTECEELDADSCG